MMPWRRFVEAAGSVLHEDRESLASIGDYGNLGVGGGNCGGNYAIPCFEIMWNQGLGPDFDFVTPHY